MNPILDKKYFIPDAEARVMPDGRLYLYGSRDVLERDGYCSDAYQVFSCDDDHLENWVCHGQSFYNGGDAPAVDWAPGVTLYAPDAICKNGKYYLYACGSNRFEAVAVGDGPAGPFRHAVPIKHADGDGIDPAVFVDDDGSAYYFWGQVELRGGRLLEDMRTLDEASIKTGILTEKEHGFHEGASIRKRGDWYYLIYTDISRGRATCLSYAISRHPLGPYVKGGVIIDNTFCDPMSWNNHGSIATYKDRWFIFYHRATQNRKDKRRVCAEEIHFTEDGKIPEVEMTCNGASLALDPFKTWDASIACRMNGGLYIKTEIVGSEAEEHITGKVDSSWSAPWLEYKYFDFREEPKTCEMLIRGHCEVVLSTENNVECGRCSIDTDVYTCFRFPVSGLQGIKPFWFSFYGTQGTVDFRSFKFNK